MAMQEERNGRHGGRTAEKKPVRRNAAKTGNTRKPPVKRQAAKQSQPAKKPAKKPAERRRQPVRIIPLGGLGEVGKNITLYECGNDAFLVDCGMMFPDESMLGVDSVLPDYTYLEQIKDRLRGIFLTHGHEDHIGGLPYFLQKVNIPLYGTRLTLGLVEGKLKEHGLLGKVKMNVVKPRQTVRVGCMAVEFIRVNHSIPDAVAMAIHTPAGVIIQTGDFKIDYTPIEGEMIDLARFAELGSRGVLCLLSDSTNAERPGATMSERKVGASFETLFNTEAASSRRIIVATFASNIHRIQQIIDAARRHDRKVAVSGRSMINVVTRAMELGYLRVPDKLLIDIEEIGRYPKEKVVLITTGSQGEPMSALSRIASGDHRQVRVSDEDYIIISATPIPGNEKHVTRVVNDLLKLGAEVIYERMYEIHVSGHACQDELRTMLALTKPKFFLPVHGEYKHLKKHADLAIGLGIPRENVRIAEIGQVLELDGVEMKLAGTVPAGQVLVDGLSVGDVGSIVLRDRKRLAEDGLIVVTAVIDRETRMLVSGPNIVSRGFVYVRESEELMAEAERIAVGALKHCRDHGIRDWGVMRVHLRDTLSQFIYRKTKRSPMILPVIMEV